MDNQNINYIDAVTSFLNNSLITLVKEQQLTLSQLKVILLICYHQLIDEKPNNLINGLLISTLKQIVDIEDSNNQESQNLEWDNNNIDAYLTNFIHPRVQKLIQTLEENE